MLYKMKRWLKPTTILLITGFAISLISVLIGISAINSVLDSLAEMDSETPIFMTMQNSGLALATSVYIFSIANCLVVTNYWMITQRRDMAIRKAFGWTNLHLVGLVAFQIAKILTVSLIVSVIFLSVLTVQNVSVYSVEMTPFFVLSSLLLMLFTLFISILIPIIRILKIHPAEVIS